MSTPAATSGTGPQRPLLPEWLLRARGYGLVALVAVAVCWVVVLVLLRLSLVTFALALALLLSALLWPLAGRLRRTGIRPAVAAFVALLLLLAALCALALLVWTRVTGQVQDLVPAVAAGIDDLRSWLTTGPLYLDPSQVDGLRDQAVAHVYGVVPDALSGARTALDVLTVLVLGLFTTYFVLKDGPAMWGWLLGWTPGRHRDRLDGAGRRAWATLAGYVQGVTVVATLDAALIGTALFVLDVPLWLSLTLLVFLGAFVPILGAFASGVVAVLVTLVTNGAADAGIVLAVVLLVEQVEGNVLQPLVVGRAVHLHPVVVLVAVTSGTLLLGIPGAVLSVPLVAVAYQVAEFLRSDRPPAPVEATAGDGG